MVLLDSFARKCGGALLDQVSQLGEGVVHVGGHRPGCLGDQPGYVPGSAAWSGAAGPGGRQLGEASREHSCRVVGVVEPTGLDRSCEELFWLVTVGFGAAEPGDKRPERLAPDDRPGLLGGQAATGGCVG